MKRNRTHVPFPLNSVAVVIAQPTPSYPPLYTIVRIINERRNDPARRDVEWVDDQGETRRSPIDVAHMRTQCGEGDEASHYKACQ